MNSIKFIAQIDITSSLKLLKICSIYPLLVYIYKSSGQLTDFFQGNMLLSECDHSTRIQSNKNYTTRFCHYYFIILPSKIAPASYIYPSDEVS